MEHLARFVVRFPWLILLIWIIGIGAIAKLTPGADVPKSPAPQPTAAQQAYALLYQSFPSNEISGSHPPIEILLLNPQVPLSSTEIAAVASPGSALEAWQSESSVAVDWPPAERLSPDRHAFLVSITFPYTDFCYSCQDQIKLLLARVASFTYGSEFPSR